MRTIRFVLTTIVAVVMVGALGVGMAAAQADENYPITDPTTKVIDDTEVKSGNEKATEVLSGNTSALPVTGGDVVGLAIVGFGALALGGVLVQRSRSAQR